MVVFGQSGCIPTQVVVFGQTGSIRAKVFLFERKWLFSGKKCFFLGKSCCIRAKVFDSG